MKKKGQLGNLQGIIIVLIIVGVLLAAGFFIFDEFEDQVNNIANTVASENSSTIAGEIGINVTGYTIEGAGSTCFNTPIITLAVNRTSSTVIESGNYTIDSDGLVINASSANFRNVSLTYDYKSGGGACTGIQDTITAMLTIPELLGLIVLIAIIGVILAVIFNVIPGARTQGA